MGRVPILEEPGPLGYAIQHYARKMGTKMGAVLFFVFLAFKEKKKNRTVPFFGPSP
jgi:hypothetical protein